MGRLLREEDVIKEILEHFCSKPVNGKHNEGEVLTVKYILSIIPEVSPSAQEWIPCATCSMPKIGQKVWVSTKWKQVKPALYRPGIRHEYVWEGEFSFLRKDEVLAWMPYTMPEPYMEDNDGNIE